MALVHNGPITKNTNWDGDLSTHGKPVSGQRVLEFIKNSLNSKIGYIYEDIKTGYDFYFSDEEDFNEWFNQTDFLKYSKDIVTLKFTNKLILLAVPKKIGYVYEDHLRGYFLGFTNEDDCNLYISNPQLYKDLVITEWRNVLGKGIPIYTLQVIDELEVDSNEDYITLGEDSDLNKEVINKTYDTSINGPLANILFEAIRKLQSEVAKLKNSFNYGICSYSGTNTAMSRVNAEYLPDVDDEPLWAIEESDFLEAILDVEMNLYHGLIPFDNINVGTENSLEIIDTASWIDKGTILEVEDPKLLIYITSTKPNIILKLRKEEEELNIDLSNLNIPILNAYNYLVIISRSSELENGTIVGKNYIWISVGNPYSDEIVALGYYTLSGLSKNIHYLNLSYTISLIDFTNLILSKLTFYSKYLDFSNLVIPSKPTDNNYIYKAAHITIRSVNTYDTLDTIKNLLLENELIFVEDTKRIFIKNNNRLVPITGGGSTIIDDNGDTMTQEEVIQILENAGIVQNEFGNLSIKDISDITFVHQDSGTKFKLCIDSEGNLHTNPIIKDENKLATKIKEIFGNEAVSVGDNFATRGFVGRLRIKEKNSATEVDVYSDAKLNSDRIKIGAFYAPARTNEIFGCSHCYIELENTSDKDFSLEGCYLHYVRNIEGNPTTSHLALTGTIPSGGTYLIRCKQMSNFDDPNTFIKVTTFDLEWYENGELIDLTHNGELEEVQGGVASNDPHGLALTYLLPNLEYNNLLWGTITQTIGDSEETLFTYNPNYIDSVYYNSVYSNISQKSYWTTYSNCMLKINDNKYIDCIYKNTFELDPAKLAYLALHPKDSSRIRNANSSVDYLYVGLSKEFIEFPKTLEKYPVSKFTPKASFEHKNVCTDKTQLDVKKPNMVTCSFGKNPYTTRCFNWISGGLFDEFVFIKLGNNWIKFESYKEGDESKELATGNLKRKEFNNQNIINCIYKRITGRFPATNILYTSHKCIINVVTEPVNSPETYTYVVGRADKNGNPDLEHCSEEYTFTLYPISYTPRIYLTTDQLGFHWIEYQSWAAAAEEVNNNITSDCLSELIIPILVNTGDMTQSGARINEWLDYYNGGKSLFKHLEQMNVVGNNDLCGNDFNILGTGDDPGKSNSYYFHVFYCYEIETEEGMIPIVNNKYIPSLYKIEFDKYVLLFVNSEITTTNCFGWFNLKNNNDPINIYTGWSVTEGTPEYFGYKENILEGEDNGFITIYTMIYNMTNNLQNKLLITLCHEMPFTVITHQNLDITTRDKSRSVSGTSLVGSHLNQISVNDKCGLLWFSRLLEYRNCKLCIGGHKHTYAITYPLMENYKYVINSQVKNSKDDGPMEMTLTLENDTSENVIWIENEYDTSKLPLAVTNIYYGMVGDTKVYSDEETTQTVNGVTYDINIPTYYGNLDSGYFAPITPVKNFYNNRSGVIYFMCLATGYKQKSNKELPSTFLKFSRFYPMSNVTNINNQKPSTDLQMPMYGIFELENNVINAYLVRLNNILSSAGKLLTQFDYGKNPITRLYLLNNTSSKWKFGTWSGDSVEKLLLISI